MRAHLRQAFYVTHPMLNSRAGMLLRVYREGQVPNLVCGCGAIDCTSATGFYCSAKNDCALARPLLVRTVRATSPTKSNSDACAGDHSVTTRLECSVTSL